MKTKQKSVTEKVVTKILNRILVPEARSMFYRMSKTNVIVFPLVFCVVDGITLLSILGGAFVGIAIAFIWADGYYRYSKWFANKSWRADPKVPIGSNLKKSYKEFRKFYDN